MSDHKEFDFSFEQFDILRGLAHGYSGIHITDDKYEMYYSRLAKRLRKLALPGFAEYIRLVKKDQKELKEFINAITTNVTSFEREAHHFAHLTEVLKSWEKKEVKIWSAGCSQGKEPYSILVNILPVCQSRGIKVSILATDLDTDVLATAQRGVYPESDLDAYSKSTKKRFFLQGKGNNAGWCRVKPVLSECMSFKQLNLIHPWSIPTRFDFIFCRNVLIYFEKDKKLEIIGRFYNNLSDTGSLFLGHSESIPHSDPNWSMKGKNIYDKVVTSRAA